MDSRKILKALPNLPLSIVHTSQENKMQYNSQSSPIGMTYFTVCLLPTVSPRQKHGQMEQELSVKYGFIKHVSQFIWDDHELKCSFRGPHYTLNLIRTRVFIFR